MKTVGIMSSFCCLQANDMAGLNRRLNLSERIHVVREYYLGSRSFKHVTENWSKNFTSPPPSKPAMHHLINKFEQLGTVADAPRNGAPKSARNAENTDLVAAAYVESPSTSQRRASVELGISRRSLGRIMDDLELKPYIPRPLHALNEDDPDRRLQFCETFLAFYEEDPDLVKKIIWTDEAHFKLNGRVNRHNSVYWSDSNPHIILTSEVNVPGVSVWAGICSSGIIGPFFFKSTVTSDAYLEMLKSKFIPAASDIIDLESCFSNKTEHLHIMAGKYVNGLITFSRTAG